MYILSEGVKVEGQLKHTAYDPFLEYLMLCSLIYISYAFMGSNSFINYFCPFLIYKNGQKVYISGDMSAL